MQRFVLPLDSYTADEMPNLSLGFMQDLFCSPRMHKHISEPSGELRRLLDAVSHKGNKHMPTD